MKMPIIAMRPVCALAAFALLAGCVGMKDATVSLVYTPASIAETPYVLAMGEFTRTLPPEKPAPNMYETSGYGFGKDISLSEPIADYLKTAMVQELRRTGATLRGEPACTIAANLNHMTLNHSGSSKLTWGSDVLYRVSAGGDSVEVPVTVTVLTKVASAEAGHSEFITKTIDGLLKSPTFASFAVAHCMRSS
jgi:hypothetical protein